MSGKDSQGRIIIIQFINTAKQCNDTPDKTDPNKHVAEAAADYEIQQQVHFAQ